MNSISSEQTLDPSLGWYRGFIQGKTRITLAWLFAVGIGFSSREYPHLPGILLCFAGASLRFWASGYLRKDQRPAVGGPYAFVRNPLYLGTYCMALGTAMAEQNWLLLGVSTVAFAAIYHYIILDEEVKLRRLFSEEYLEYCTLVPRFFPRVWPPFLPASANALLRVNPEKEQHGFSWSIAIQNKAYEAYASFAGLLVFVSIAAFLWKHL
jgi:protein-S-isoprenylcysteine O-methyltransferase Ste14